jgi:hypothetical protein
MMPSPGRVSPGEAIVVVIIPVIATTPHELYDGAAGGVDTGLWRC